MATPSKNDAQYQNYAGIAGVDPISYATSNATRCDFTHFGKPVQDEILNLIDIAKASTCVPVRNETGSTLPIGPVRISGYHAATGEFKIALPDSANNLPAHFVLRSALTTATSGLAYKGGALSVSLDTSGAAVGDPVYLSGTTISLTAPSGLSVIKQRIGRVSTAANPGTIMAWVEEPYVRAGDAPKLTATVAAVDSTHKDVSLQLVSADGVSIAAVALVECWLADSAYLWETSTAADGITIEHGNAADVPTSNKRVRVLTDTDGLARIRIERTGAHTWYLSASLGGIVYASSAITFS